MRIQENYPLRSCNSLSLEQSARYFIEINTLDELNEALAFSRVQGLHWLALGAGSNLVLSKDYPGVMLRMNLRGINRIAEDQESFQIRVAAGENWHMLVKQCLAQGWYGLENLALIPGTAGAAPVQNIGAYGIELCERLVTVEAWDEHQQAFVALSSDECCFGYRDSLFRQQPGRFIITALVLRLFKRPQVNIRYDALQQFFKGMDVSTITPQRVFDAVVSIRQSKLPDPAFLPNVGSFFKNPVVSEQIHGCLKERYPGLVSYPAGPGRYKLAAGWLIDQAGWKGRREGAFGVHEAQALVLVHYATNTSSGPATGKELLQFANRIQEDIRVRYGISLEIEPVVV